MGGAAACRALRAEARFFLSPFSAEVQTNGIEGTEKNLLLGTIQIHREDMDDTESEFEHRFPVGMWLDILNYYRDSCSAGRYAGDRKAGLRFDLRSLSPVQ